MNRDGPITGMDSNRAQQLWCHNLEVVEATRKASHSLSIVDFIPGLKILPIRFPLWLHACLV